MADEKLCCDRSTRPKAVLAVGLRQECTASELSDRNDGQQSFSAALPKSALIRGNLR
jgi:hypothetical protein